MIHLSSSRLISCSCLVQNKVRFCPEENKLSFDLGSLSDGVGMKMAPWDELMIKYWLMTVISASQMIVKGSEFHLEAGSRLSVPVTTQVQGQLCEPLIQHNHG